MCVHYPQAGSNPTLFFKWDLTALNSEFSFSVTDIHNKVKELRLPNHLAIVGGRIVGFMPFSGV